MICRGKGISKVLYAVACTMAMMILGLPLRAQWRYHPGFEGLSRLGTPDGDPVVTTKFTDVTDSLGRRITWGITPRGIYTSVTDTSWRRSWPSRGSKELFNTDITAGNYNWDLGSSLYKSYTALLGRGDVYYFSPFDRYTTATEWNSIPFNFSYESGLKIKGNLNYYVMSYQSVYLTRDFGSSWQADMNGVGSSYPLDISLDGRKFAWLATTNGLYTQHPDSNSWAKVSAYPENAAYSVFRDRLDRIYVSSYGSPYYSTDYGMTWTQHNSGLPGLGFSGFADDAFGNIYGWTGGSFGSMIYRSAGGTNPWVRIDSAITSRMFDPSHTQIINDIEGDSVLIAATILGYFLSRDQGDTWCPDDCGIESFYIYGFRVLPSDLRVVCTNLGIYARGPTDTSWTKHFPPNRFFLDGLPLYKDGNGYLYTQALKTDPTNYFSIRYSWRSTDFGINWARDDSTGSSLVQNPNRFAVNELGTQNCVTFGSPNQLFKKSFGSPWIPNSLGYSYRTNEVPTFLGGDDHGNNFAAFASLAYTFAANSPRGNSPASSSDGILWRQPVSGGPWVTDTVGLNNNAVYAIASDSTGSPIAGTFGDGLYRKSAGTWSKIPPPPGLELSSAPVVSVDRSNAIFAGYVDLLGNNFLWRGVWFTTDLGGTWKYAGLDSIAIQALEVEGDTTFAVTQADGIYRLTRNGVSAVAGRTMSPTGFELSQNYPNPFNPATVIKYRLPASAGVRLVVYDILGREVSTLVNERQNPGSYEVHFNGRGLASGVYLYRLQAGQFVETKKLVLLK